MEHRIAVYRPASPVVTYSVALGLIAGILLGWEYLVDALGPIALSVLSQPSEISREINAYFQSGELLRATSVSALRVLPGLVLGTVAGYLLGLGLAFVSSLSIFCFVLVVFTLTFSKFSVYILFLQWFPLGDMPKHAVIFYYAFVVQFAGVYIKTSHTLFGGIAQDREMAEMLEVARVDGANRRQVYRYLLFPLLLPTSYQFFVAQTAFAWSMLVYVEGYVTSVGLGFEVSENRFMGATIIMSRTFVLMIGAGVTILAGRLLYKFLQPWNR